MRIEIHGKHMQVTPSIREHAERAVQRLHRFYDRVDDATVVLSTERNRHIAEITLHCNHLVLRAEEATRDLYASIDAASEKLERQLRRYKERIRDYHNRRKPSVALAEEIGEQESAAAEETAPDDEEPRVVRTKRFTLKPMNIEEAVLQMELVGHSFFVFRNAETEQVNVLYRRNDGNYGLIEPDE